MVAAYMQATHLHHRADIHLQKGPSWPTAQVFDQLPPSAAHQAAIMPNNNNNNNSVSVLLYLYFTTSTDYIDAIGRVQIFFFREIKL
jgi:hypothetical protein